MHSLRNCVLGAKRFSLNRARNSRGSQAAAPVCQAWGPVASGNLIHALLSNTPSDITQEYSSLRETHRTHYVQTSVLALAAQSRQKAALTGWPRFPAHAGEISQGAQPAHGRLAGRTGSLVAGQAADLCPTPRWGQPHWCPLQEEDERLQSRGFKPLAEIALTVPCDK